MSVEELKTALNKLIASEDDPAVLAAVYTLLNKQQTDATYKQVLTERALLAEEDIEKGDTYTVEEVKEKTNKLLGR